MVASPERTALGGVEIAPMRRRHLRQVLSIERRVYPRGWTPALFVSELEQTTTRAYFVALVPPSALRGETRAPAGGLRRRRVVGYAGVLVQAGEAHVTTVAVDPAIHRRKVATHLLLALVEGARSRGADAMTLEVRAGNYGAQRLYSSFGFVPAGVRRGYYAETGEDAVIMWLEDLRGEDVAARIAAQRARLAEPGGASGAPDFPVPWVQGRQGLTGEERR